MEYRTDKDEFRLALWAFAFVCFFIPAFRFPHLRIILLAISGYCLFKAIRWYIFIYQKNLPDYESIEWTEIEDIFAVGSELCKRIRAFETGIEKAKEAQDIEEIREYFSFVMGDSVTGETYSYCFDDVDDVTDIIGVFERKRIECLNGILECAERFAYWYTKTMEKKVANNIRKMWRDVKEQNKEKEEREKRIKQEPKKYKTRRTWGWAYTTIPYAKGYSEGIVRCERCKKAFGLRNGQADIIAMYTGKEADKVEVYKYRFCSYQCLNLWLDEPDTDNDTYKRSIKTRKNAKVIKG